MSLEIHHDEAAQVQVVEQEVEVEVSVPERDPVLAIHEAELAAELEQEVLEVVDEGLLQRALRRLELRAASAARAGGGSGGPPGPRGVSGGFLSFAPPGARVLAAPRRRGCGDRRAARPARAGRSA